MKTFEQFIFCDELKFDYDLVHKDYTSLKKLPHS